MSKWFEVKLVNVEEYLVEVEDYQGEDEAMECIQLNAGDWLEMEVVEYDGDVESSKQHFNNTFYL